MVSLQARALAASGWHVLQLDLSGCGDSSGSFSEANWAVWLDDILAAREWVNAHCPGPLWIWGLRLGALLACASLTQVPLEDVGLLFWQPVLSGSQHLQQFLRIKGAGERIASGREGVSTQGLVEQLRAGNSVEVAGYDLMPQIALPMAESSLSLPAGVGHVRWFDISPRIGGEVNPASRRVLDAWAAQVDVDINVVHGPSFWQTQEIELAPELLTVTTGMFAA